MPVGIRVEGYRSLMRSFALISDGLRKDLRVQLAEAAAPVKPAAESLADSRIRNIGDRWSRMRIGVTTTAVYLAPASRRRRGSPRPNLAPLLMNESMLPAVTAELPAVRTRLEGWLDELGSGAGF